jgi:hypothetical protein
LIFVRQVPDLQQFSSELTVTLTVNEDDPLDDIMAARKHRRNIASGPSTSGPSPENDITNKTDSAGSGESVPGSDSPSVDGSELPPFSEHGHSSNTSAEDLDGCSSLSSDGETEVGIGTASGSGGSVLQSRGKAAKQRKVGAAAKPPAPQTAKAKKSKAAAKGAKKRTR